MTRRTSSRSSSRRKAANRHRCSISTNRRRHRRSTSRCTLVVYLVAQSPQMLNGSTMSRTASSSSTIPSTSVSPNTTGCRGRNSKTFSPSIPITTTTLYYAHNATYYAASPSQSLTNSIYFPKTFSTFVSSEPLRLRKQPVGTSTTSITTRNVSTDSTAHRHAQTHPRLSA